MLTANLLTALAAKRASDYLHKILLAAVLAYPVQAFDTTPVGRVMNRFGRDLDTVDVRLPEIARAVVFLALRLTATLLVVTINLPMFFVVDIIIIVTYVVFQVETHSAIRCHNAFIHT